MPTRELQEFLHLNIAGLEIDARWALREMAIFDDRGWSPETLLIIQMQNDAEILRELASQIDARREKLIREKESNHVDKDG